MLISLSPYVLWIVDEISPIKISTSIEEKKFHDCQTLSFSKTKSWLSDTYGEGTPWYWPKKSSWCCSEATFQSSGKLSFLKQLRFTTKKDSVVTVSLFLLIFLSGSQSFWSGWEVPPATSRPKLNLKLAVHTHCCFCRWLVAWRLIHSTFCIFPRKSEFLKNN